MLSQRNTTGHISSFLCSVKPWFVVANVRKNVSFRYQICKDCSQFSPLYSKNLDAWEEKTSRSRGGKYLSCLLVSSFPFCFCLCSVFLSLSFYRVVTGFINLLITELVDVLPLPRQVPFAIKISPAPTLQCGQRFQSKVLTQLMLFYAEITPGSKASPKANTRTRVWPANTPLLQPLQTWRNSWWPSDFFRSNLSSAVKAVSWNNLRTTACV